MKGIVVLVVVLVVWKLFGKQLMGMFLLSAAGKAALTDIGAKAVAAQPDTICLNAMNSPAWRDLDIPQILSTLRTAGFIDVGTFTVDKMPGVQLAMLVNVNDCVSAHVYDHPKAGTWIELVTRYDDGTSTTLTTLPSTGQKQPAWLTTIRAGKAPATDLVRQLVQNRRAGAMKPVTPASAVRDFEAGYAKYMQWRKSTPMSADEVAPTVQKWAQAPQGGTVSNM